MKNRDKN